MNENDKAKLLSRLRKVLALANSPNENEAAVAMEKVQSILAEHNLTMADIGSGSKDEQGFVYDTSTPETESVPWRRSILVAVGKLYFCQYFYTHVYHERPNSKRPGAYKRKDVHTFVGAAHNTAVASMMATYLMETVDRLAREGSLKMPLKKRSRYVTSFQHACSQRLWARIMDRVEAAKKGEVKTESGTTLPALASLYDQTQSALDKFLADMDLQTKKGRPISMSSVEGAMDGSRAGNSIGLDSQVGAGRGPAQIGHG